jgi:hypothetical protein
MFEECPENRGRSTFRSYTTLQNVRPYKGKMKLSL